MESGQPTALTPNEEVTLRRIAFGLGGGSTLRPEDVNRLTKLNLIALRDKNLILTAQGESRITQRSPERDTLSRKEIDVLAKALDRKL
jgi:hypothetical protein